MMTNQTSADVQIPSRAISVIVPVYNVEAYLEECLNSLVNQTFEDYEIILVNDGATDNSQTIIDRYAQEYPEKIRAFQKENGGLSSARNFGLEHARGEYVAFVDSDDYVSLDMLEKLYQAATTQNADIVICDMVKFRITQNNLVKETLFQPTKGIEYGKSVTENPLLLRHATSFACNKLFKRSLIDISGLTFPVGQWFEDSAVVYNWVTLAGRLAAVQEGLYYYRIGRPGAITNSFSDKIFDIFKSCDSIVDFHQKTGIMSTLYKEVEYLCIMHLHARLIALRNCTNLSLAFRFADQCFTWLDHTFPSWRNNCYYLEKQEDKLMRNKLRGIEACRNSLAKTKVYYTLHLPLVAARKAKKSLTKKKTLSLSPKKEHSEQEATALRSRQLEVRALQMYSLEIMKVIHRFCEENGLTYYLAEGSLLGAVRHHGFIPWDDDLDICMPRADFEKFVELWGKQSVEDCILQYTNTYKKHYIPFAKIIQTRETGFSNNEEYAPKKYQGPFVDIFPLDAFVPQLAEQDKYAISRIRRYRDYLLVKIGYIKNKSSRRAMSLPAALHSYSALHQKINKEIGMYRNSQYGYISNICSSYRISKETFKTEWFHHPVLVDFEGEKLYIPNGAHEILTTTYGDYMTMPPVEQRICKHGFRVNPEVRQRLIQEAEQDQT